LGWGGVLAQSSLAPLAGFMGVPRVSIAGLLSRLALVFLMMRCRRITIPYGTSGLCLSSYSPQSILFLKPHHTPFVHASSVVFHIIFITDA